MKDIKTEVREKRIKKLKTFIQNNYPGVRVLNYEGLNGDYREVVYADESSDDEDDIVVEYTSCWNYLKIFGLTDDEFNKLFRGEE